jgi:nitric oxide reductase large subunit
METKNKIIGVIIILVITIFGGFYMKNFYIPYKTAVAVIPDYILFLIVQYFVIGVLFVIVSLVIYQLDKYTFNR